MLIPLFFTDNELVRPISAPVRYGCSCPGSDELFHGLQAWVQCENDKEREPESQNDGNWRKIQDMKEP